MRRISELIDHLVAAEEEAVSDHAPVEAQVIVRARAVLEAYAFHETRRGERLAILTDEAERAIRRDTRKPA